MTPDGGLIDKTGDDVFVVAGASPLPAGDAHLGQVLVPWVDRRTYGMDPSNRNAALPDRSTVASVLRHIGLGKDAGVLWIDQSGAWQSGPLRGRSTKPQARYIGPAAQETARNDRQSEIEAQITDARSATQELGADLGRIEDRSEMTRMETQRLPDDSPVRTALAQAVAAAESTNQLRVKVAEAETQVGRRRQIANAARDKRDVTALDLGLTGWTDRLDDFEHELQDYSRTLAALWPTIEAQVDCQRETTRARKSLEEAQNDERGRAEIHHELQLKAQGAAAACDVLQSSVGRTAEDILAELQRARDQEQGVRNALETAGNDKIDHSNTVAASEERVRSAGETLEQDAGRRDEACGRFERFARAGLLSVSAPGVACPTAGGWSATRTVDIVRAVLAVLKDRDASEPTWDRLQKGIHQHIQTLIDTLQPHGHRPFSALEDDVLSVRVEILSRQLGMTELARNLNEQIRERQRILDAREREILERHLIGEVSTHLHDLLHGAEQWVDEINGEIQSRPMSTGMALRFRWGVGDDAPSGLAAVRRLLLRTEGAWSAEDRQALGVFLQRQIQTVRASYDTGSWTEHLRLALDYRSWHQFIVERQQDGRWQRLTRWTHGTGSGGEKTVALTMPQCAAAAAHYRSADPLAPRLILLDEAFVGIDNDMRSKCMALLTAFDLDFVMTSEREWGCYPTVPRLAIYHLSARAGIDAVGVSRWVWNGRTRERASDAPPPSPAVSTEAATRTGNGNGQS